jgi:hypothetical protein
VGAQTWLGDILASVMVGVLLYCAGRLVAAPLWHRSIHYDVNISHVLMGAAMAGVLAPALNVIPNGVWEVVFSFLAIWFLGKSLRFVSQHGIGGTDDLHAHRISHYLTHLVMACAMLYMYLAGAPSAIGGASESAMTSVTGGTANFVGLPLFFVLVLFGSAIWQLDALNRYSPARASVMATAAGPASGVLVSPQIEQPRWLAPRLEMGCHIAMCITMGYMLILML